MIKSKKKGFTIIELVVVMTIILLITATSVVSYSRLTTNYKKKEYNRIISNFEAAAEAYAAENQDIKDRIFSGSGYATVTLKTLSDETLISDSVKDPITGELFDPKNYVSVYLDENRNFHAVYMAEKGSSFTNSRASQKILAGSLYGRVQMLEYIIGYSKGEYDELTGSYGTKEIDYSLVEIKVTDITDGRNQEMSDSSRVPTTREYIGHTFRIDYSFNFENDGLKTLKREVTVYNIAPTIKSVRLNPDEPGKYTNGDVMATVDATSVHGSVRYHYVVDGVETTSDLNTFTIEQNAVIQFFVEDPYGWKSDTVSRTVSLIDKEAPTFELEVIPTMRIQASINVIDPKDNASGLDYRPMQFDNGDWRYLNTQYVNRNKTYTVSLKDKAGNVATKTAQVTNILMMDMIGKDPSEVKAYTDSWGITLKQTGSTNRFATVAAQSISEGTAISNGMVLTITLVAPKQSVTINVSNGYVTGSDKIKAVDKGESTTFTVAPNNGYQLSGASVVCSNGVKATLSGGTLTVSDILTNADCTVSMSKIPVVYYPPSSSSDDDDDDYCGDSCIISQMKKNSAAWFDASPSERERLHQENVKLNNQLSSNNKSNFNSNGTWTKKKDDKRLY